MSNNQVKVIRRDNEYQVWIQYPNEQALQVATFLLPSQGDFQKDSEFVKTIITAYQKRISK